MTRTANKFPFTKDRLRRLEPGDKVARYYDDKTPGLFLTITPNGVRTFYLAYASPVEEVSAPGGKTRKRSRQIKLGRYPTLTIDQARAAASEHLGTVARGNDPMFDRRARAREAAAQMALEKHGSMLTLRVQLDDDESAWRRYTRREKLKRAEETAAIIRHHFGRWLESPMSMFTREQLQGWIDERTSAGASAGSINRPLAYLRSIFHRCRVAYPGFTNNPFEGLDTPTEKKSHVRYLFDDERLRFQAALAKQPRYMQVLVFILWRTGARKNEILGSRWRQIEKRGDRHYLVLKDTKNREDRLLPLSREVVRVLTEWRLAEGLRETDWLFPSPRVAGVRLTSIQKQWAKLLGDAQIENFRVHDLRHDFATQSLANGTPPHVLQRVLGHKDLATTLNRYGHVTPEEMHDAVERFTL
ncbi:MAG: site-specific integrase [Pseudomonadota bacterium]